MEHQRRGGGVAIRPDLWSEADLAGKNSLFAILMDGRRAPRGGRDIASQDCPATAAKRFRVMGDVAPQLSILVTNSRAVLAFAHGLWSM